MNTALSWLRVGPPLLGTLAGLLVLLLLGASIRGWASAALVIAAAWTARILAPARAGAGPEPLLRVMARVQVAPRAQLALIETGGRRYLVATGASVATLPLEEPR